MKKTFALAAATMLLTATGVFAQAASPGGTMTKSTAPKAEGMKADASGMKADTADADAAKPKAHHRMAKNEAALNASEAETTKQLNQEQAQMASNNGMSSGMSSSPGMANGSSSAGSSDATTDSGRPNSGMGRVQGANSGVEGRVGGTNSDNPAP